VGNSSLCDLIVSRDMQVDERESYMTNLPLTPNRSSKPSSTRSWMSRIGEASVMPVMATRNGHGGLAWSLPMGDKSMRQPQDGAPEKHSRVARMSSYLNGCLLNEPEDARMTGGTRSLTRRLLGLNVMSKRRKSPETIPNVVAARSQVA
jgi:hypothetical protein